MAVKRLSIPTVSSHKDTCQKDTGQNRTDPSKLVTVESG